MSAIHSPWQWNGNTLEPITKDPNKSAVFSILDAEGGYGFLCSKPAETLAEIAECKQLIVTAPKLLRALEAVVAATAMHPVHLERAIGCARSVIAEATGGEA